MHTIFKTNKIVCSIGIEMKLELLKFIHLKCLVILFHFQGFFYYVYIYKSKMIHHSLPEVTRIIHSRIVSCVLHSARPTEFSATTLYSPLSLALTLKMSMEQTPQVFEM